MSLFNIKPPQDVIVKADRVAAMPERIFPKYVALTLCEA